MLNSPLDAAATNHFMAAACSDYLLVCEASATSLTDGRWHFTLENAGGEHIFGAGDEEPGDLNRLSLLAAVRGLESIDGAASVSLLSNNRYLIRSLSDSLPRWRENGFAWEHFGRRIDVQHADLWRRIDGALAIHRVEACLVSSRLVSRGDSSRRHAEIGGTRLRVDSPHRGVAAPKSQHKPSDKLRSWLLGGGASHQGETPRRRFTPADLLETA